MSKIEIKQANDEVTIKKCFPVVVELRPHLTEESFYEQALNQFKEGYQLWYIEANDDVVSIIGFRIQHFLRQGKIFYIDDFATLSTAQRKGYADKLMEWAIEQAKTVYHCDAVDLDTGYTRHSAHKLYLKHGFKLHGHHFSLICKNELAG